MEPQDFAKKDREGSGFSKRRISSILKGPRKSARFPDPDQQENVVESAKPVEKRISRRVSFAPANDVLLFSKDVKNPSPARSPLQELMTAAGATAQNRVQVVVAEDGIPQTRALETLLNAPLHATQQDKVSFDTVEGFGEKTVMFSTDDAYMDMTHSQTMNVSSYADTSLHVCDALPAGGEKKWMFTADDASMDMSLLPARKKDLSVEKDIASSVSSLDHGFENFLASLSKPGGPSSLATVDTNISVAQVKTQKATVEKENLLPASVSAVMEKSLNKPRKAEESSCGLSPDVDVSMNLTEVQTGRILSVAVDDNPFQCLFPTQDMYALSDEGESQTAKVTMIKSEPQDMASSKNPARNASQPRSKVNLNARDEVTDKTIRFTAGDEFMDMTQSHTVNIARGPLASQPGSADGLESGFKNFLTGLSKPTVPSVNTGIEIEAPLTAASCQKTINRDRSLCELKTPMPDASIENWSLDPSRSCRESSMGVEICPDIDMTMEMTETQTGRILEVSGSNDPFQFLFPSQDIYPHGGSLKKAEMTSGQKNSEALGSLKHAGLHTQDEFDPEDDHREKTVRFSADDACMDVTRSHTVNIGTDFSHKLSGSLSSKDKTIRFNVKDAGMDMTQCLTVNIANYLGSDSILLSEKKPESEKRGPLRDRSSSAQGLDLESNVFERKTSSAAPFSNVRDSSAGGPICPEDDVSMDMDMTEAQTGRIVGLTHTDDALQGPFPPQDIFPQSGYLKKAEMTSGRKSSGALGSSDCTGVDKSSRTSFKTTMRRSQVKFDAEDDCRGESVRSSPDDADTNVTDCLDVNVVTTTALHSVLPHQETNITEAHRDADLHLIGKTRGRSLSTRSLDPGFKNSLSRMSCPWVNPVKVVTPTGQRPPEAADANDQLQIQNPGGDTTNDALEKSQNKTMTDFTELDQSMEMTAAQTGRIFGQSCTDELPQCLTSSQDSDLKFELSKQTEAKSRQSDEAASVEISNLTESADSFEIVTRKEHEPRNETTSSQKTDDGSSLSAVDQDLETFGSRKSRRISLADIHSKVKRLSHMINTAPGAFVVESCTETLPHFDDDSDKTKPPPAVEPELDMSLQSKEEETQNQYLTRGGESPAAATPFNLKTKQLMSRLSMGGFKAKLPQLSKPSDPKVQTWAGEHMKTMTVNITNQLSNVDHDVSDIFDEQLDSSEDLSDTLKPKSPEEIPEKMSHQQEADEELLEEDVFEEDFISAVQGKKRPLPNDENNMEDEKRMKASIEEADDIYDMGSQSHSVEYDGNLTSAPTMTTHTTDCSSSSSHTASGRCEATFESTFKHSMYESQLEDYTSDAQKKLSDGTITVLEFLKLFNIDFVIHNSRQSVLPGRIPSDTERTEMDVLRERHICRPKQTVYETDVLSLTEKVEGLKVRLQDLDKPLKTMNQALWDEMRNSSEKELKSFGLKLKEKNSFFRKTSKVLGHEMKEVLYSNLVQANLEEQQKLRGTIEQADEMIKSLDDCICEMEKELAAVEEKGFDGKPGLGSCQEEMKKVSEALADNDRQVAELELLKKQNSSKLNRLQTDTRNLESHITAMHLVNEWKLGEKQENCSVYTFLHETMHLQLVYEKSEGTDADHQTERKISHINFKLQLNDEKSRCHARLVHKLLSHYVDSKASWVEKYPTSRHVPTLLHDVGLVVSRCRLLGEELRLLKKWGGLKLDILDIGCEDTRVHIVFSSIKKLSKFKVVFSVGLIEQLCVVQVESFHNVIGSTGRQQIEEVVASFIPSKNLLTKIIKKIHDHLLC